MKLRSAQSYSWEFPLAFVIEQVLFLHLETGHQIIAGKITQ
jgi:hypothetical protein